MLFVSENIENKVSCW